jgi:hypothetical protein
MAIYLQRAYVKGSYRFVCLRNVYVAHYYCINVPPSTHHNNIFAHATLMHEAPWGVLCVYISVLVSIPYNDLELFWQ